MKGLHDGERGSREESQIRKKSVVVVVVVVIMINYFCLICKRFSVLVFLFSHLYAPVEVNADQELPAMGGRGARRTLTGGGAGWARARGRRSSSPLPSES